MGSFEKYEQVISEVIELTSNDKFQWKENSEYKKTGVVELSEYFCSGVTGDLVRFRRKVLGGNDDDAQFELSFSEKEEEVLRIRLPVQSPLGLRLLGLYDLVISQLAAQASDRVLSNLKKNK